MEPSLHEHGSSEGRLTADGPHHDWQRSSKAVLLAEALNSEPEGERAGEVQLGSPMPAPAGAIVARGPDQNREGRQFHSTGEGQTGFPSLAGCTFSQLGEPLLLSLQQILRDSTAKTTTMAKDEIYPLPLGEYEGVPSAKQPWLKAILLGLNSFYGSTPESHRAPTALQKRLVTSLVKFLDRMWDWPERVPASTFDDLFKIKGVDYRGEEVKLAQAFTWSSISAAFPKEVGSLELQDFCTGGCRIYVQEFEKFLLPPEMQTVGRTPQIRVADHDWPEVCEGLLKTGICSLLPRRFLHHVGPHPVLNGLFAVSKNEFKDGIELQRLIMNLVPTNRLCKSLKGDTGTLPSISGFSAFYLDDGEVAMMSSEDIKCFYYLFKIPRSWWPFMGFAGRVPQHLVPRCWAGEPCHLVAQVLPMGFINSVGLAQHIHRNVVHWSMARGGCDAAGETELRRDRPAPRGPGMFRVYLDNWDEVRKVDKQLAHDIEGHPSAHQLALRHQYELVKLPRHPKKAVESALQAEVQGALLDGEAGVAYAKPDKVLKYLALAWELVSRGAATQRELQVIAGGLVYICMFRRALLGGLNAIWQHIESLKLEPPVVRHPLPAVVKKEVMRFVALIPLAQMDFRLDMVTQVTASDASLTGGGVSASVGLTSYGLAAQAALVRGDETEPFETVEVLTIGLFDGIAALRVAADILHLVVAGHISVECNEAANRVVEAAFPGTVLVPSIQEINFDMVQGWACEFTGLGVVLVGAGPPCQGVSGLNADRKGSQKDARSSLYKEVPRVEALIRKCFSWAQVHLFLENVASMDTADRAAMSEDLGMTPLKVDAAGISLARRPRLYWLTWEVNSEAGLVLEDPHGQGWEALQPVTLTADFDQKDFLQAGWSMPPGHRFPTFTTARPSPTPGRRPAGLHSCDEEALARWREDSHRYPPYQYKAEYCVHHASGGVRVASVTEREVILGFPANYTEQCLPKSQRQGEGWSDLRKTLLGNSWSVPVVVCLLKSLFERLGACPKTSIQALVDRGAPGKGVRLQTILLRPPTRREVTVVAPDAGLARKLTGLVSVQGQDLMVQSASEPLNRHQRIRYTIPSRLWKWKEVTGWQWRGSKEHINVLEMRATLTTVRWWIMKQRRVNCRAIHLVDSMVVLHSLSRGRSSSRKLRRTVMRIGALSLLSNIHPLWTYAHTSQNPADRLSRRLRVKKWGKVKRS